MSETEMDLSSFRDCTRLSRADPSWEIGCRVSAVATDTRDPGQAWGIAAGPSLVPVTFRLVVVATAVFAGGTPAVGSAVVKLGLRAGLARLLVSAPLSI